MPSVAFGAGFAKQSLFLSRQSVTEGETVQLHAVLANEAAAAFTGQILFNDSGTKIGAVPVTLASGEGTVVSVSWKPLAGSHPITAELTDSGGAVVETLKETFTIAAKPKPVSSGGSGAAVIGSSQGIQSGIGNVSPEVAGVMAPVFTLVDGARSSIADVLDAQLTGTKAAIGPSAGNPGQVLSAEATKNAASNPMGALWFILQTLYFYLLTILRFIVGSAGVFYPLVAVAFLYFLWRMFRRFRRPSY